MERATPPHTYSYSKTKLTARVWHKYVIHNLRHGTATERRIEEAKVWALDNIEPGDWMLHVMDRKACALFFIANDDDACLFELAHMLHRDDKRGKTA